MWTDKMILEYEEGRRDLRKKLEQLGDSPEDRKDRKIINSMIKDMSFAMEWMDKGSEPDVFQGIDKRNAYHKSILSDMELFPSLDIMPQEERKLTEEERNAIVNKLAGLSPRERQCFIFSKAYLWTQEEIAEELGVSRRTVRQAINGAKKKLDL